MFLADQMLISFDIRIDQFFRYSVFKVLTKDLFSVLLAVSAIKSRELPLLPFHRSCSVVFINKSGSHLLFHTVSSIVPSAVQVLTVVFGMRTGVTPARIATGQI